MKRRSFLQSIFGLGALAVVPNISTASAVPVIVRNGIGDYTIHYTRVPESPGTFAVGVEYTGNGTYQSPLPNRIINADMIYIKSREYSSGYEIFDTNPNR